MRAVFLHVLGDALGSVGVIVSALVIRSDVGDWKYKVDPIMRSVQGGPHHEVCTRWTPS